MCYYIVVLIVWILLPPETPKAMLSTVTTQKHAFHNFGYTYCIIIDIA